MQETGGKGGCDQRMIHPRQSQIYRSFLAIMKDVSEYAGVEKWEMWSRRRIADAGQKQRTDELGMKMTAQTTIYRRKLPRHTVERRKDP
jgi:hypothetical protein